MEQRYDALSVRLIRELLSLEQIDKRASELGLNRSQFVTKALLMLVNFDLDFWKKITRYAENLRIPEWLVIQNMLIKRFAREDAEAQVFGRQSKMLDEFISFYDETGPRTPTGEELYNILKAQYVFEFERKLLRQALAEEATGTPLHPREEAILKKYRDKLIKDEFDEDEIITEEELNE